jgi:hypothetical protein
MPEYDHIPEQIRKMVAFNNYLVAKGVVKPPEPVHPSFNDLRRWLVSLLLLNKGTPYEYVLATQLLDDNCKNLILQLINLCRDNIYPYHFIEVLLGANDKDTDAVISEALIAMETDVMEYIHDHPGD